jgi:transposase InsO family protein
MTERENEDREKRAREAALFRFSLIAPGIRGTHGDESKAAYYRRICSEPLALPDGRSVRYNPKTLENWESDYRHGGMEALTPGFRSDKGQSRRLSREAVEQAYAIKRRFPKLNGLQVHAKLLDDGFIDSGVSVRTVQRFLKRAGIKSVEDVVQKDRKAFEESAFGNLWQADTAFLPYLKDETGRNRRTYLVMIVDDHTRLVVGARIFFEDNAANFQTVFKDAVASFGAPVKLYCDNGSPYQNDQLKYICASLGVILIHAPIRDGAAKGKVERSFGTFRSRWLNGLDMDTIETIGDFNDELREYVMRHNLTPNSSIETSPMQRFLACENFATDPGGPERLEEHFTNRLTRKVRNDATIRIGGVAYDVPIQFCGRSVEVRFLPGREAEGYVLDGKARHPLVLTDKAANARTKRKTLVVDYGEVAKGDE